MGEMAIPNKSKMQQLSALQYRTEKPQKRNWKFLLGLIASVFVLGVIAVVIRDNFTIGDGGSIANRVPWWIILIAFACILYWVVYFGWKLKNWVIEWVLSMAYGLLIMTIILLIGYEAILGGIAVDWMKTMVGSLFVGSGGTVLGIGVKLIIKPLFSLLKRTFLWEAR